MNWWIFKKKKLIQICCMWLFVVIVPTSDLFSSYDCAVLLLNNKQLITKCVYSHGQELNSNLNIKLVAPSTTYNRICMLRPWGKSRKSAMNNKTALLKKFKPSHVLINFKVLVALCLMYACVHVNTTYTQGPTHKGERRYLRAELRQWTRVRLPRSCKSFELWNFSRQPSFWNAFKLT